MPTPISAQATPQQHSPRLDHTVPAQTNQPWGTSGARPQSEHREHQQFSQQELYRLEQEKRYHHHHHHQQQQQQQQQLQYNRQPGISQQETGGRYRPPDDSRFMGRQGPPCFPQNIRNDRESYGSGGTYDRNLMYTNTGPPYPAQPIPLSLRAADVRMNAHYRPQQPQHDMHYRPPPVAAVFNHPNTATHQSLQPSDQYPQFQDDSSDVAENPLIEGIDKDVLSAQDEVHKMYADPNESINDPEQCFEIPYDPNLICPKCGKQFRRGEIQKFRKHHEGCTGR